jgi:hypothetical protein
LRLSANITGAHWAPRGRWTLSAWTLLVVGVAVGIAGSYIEHASVDVVCSDTWDYIKMIDGFMIDGFLSGAFDASEFLKAHNQNRTAIIVGVLLADYCWCAFGISAI